MLPKRKIDPNKTAPIGDPWVDKDFQEVYPNLYWFMFCTTYKEGENRVTGSISLFVKHCALSCFVNDNDRQVSAVLTAPTWEELFQLIDDGIKADSLPWKQKSSYGGDKKTPF